MDFEEKHYNFLNGSVKYKFKSLDDCRKFLNELDNYNIKNNLLLNSFSDDTIAIIYKNSCSSGTACLHMSKWGLRYSFSLTGNFIYYENNTYAIDLI